MIGRQSSSSNSLSRRIGSPSPTKMGRYWMLSKWPLSIAFFILICLGYGFVLVLLAPNLNQDYRNSKIFSFPHSVDFEKEDLDAKSNANFGPSPIDTAHLACQTKLHPRLNQQYRLDQKHKISFDSISPVLKSFISSKIEELTVLNALEDREHLVSPYDPTDLVELGYRMRNFSRISRIVRDVQSAYVSIGSLNSESFCDSQVLALMSLFVRMQNFLLPWIRSNQDAGSSNELIKMWSNIEAINSKGIVICGGDMHMPYIQGLIWSIREIHKSDLGIEIFYLGKKDLSDESIKSLESMAHSVNCRNIFDFFDEKTLNLHGWDIKPFSVLASSFSEVILVDGDVAFIQKPDILFSSELYLTSGALFFHDRTWYGKRWDPVEILSKVSPTYSYRVKNLRSFSRLTEHEMESGVVVINKAKRFLGIIGACKLLNPFERSVVYSKIHGDKESYWIGFEMMEEDYSFNKWFPGSIGFRDAQNNTCGRMVHFDIDGNPVWWNGGFKNAEKYVPNYDKLPFLSMNYFDDGGRSSDITDERIGIWTSDESVNYCITSSIRGSRLLNQEWMDVANSAVHAFKQFYRFTKLDSVRQWHLKNLRNIPKFSNL